MPEQPTEEAPRGGGFDQPAGGLETEAQLLIDAPAETSDFGQVTRAQTEMVVERPSGLYFVDPTGDFASHAVPLPGRTAPGSAKARSKLSRLGWGFWVAVGWCAFVILLAIFANLLPLPNPNISTPSCLSVVPGAGPGPGHWLGCDSASRDILSRVAYGARVSLIVGFASIAMGLLFGGTTGLIAGYFRGWFDEIMTVLANAFLAFPSLILGLAIVSFLGHSLLDVTLIIAIVAWPLLFRVVRASTIEYGERDYILAARALGSTRWRILAKQLLPDVVPSAVTYGLVGVGLAIVGEGALSYLGQSVGDPTPTWGKMIAQGSQNLSQNVSQLLAPAIAMFLFILAVNFIGDRLRSILDVREGVL